MCLQSACHAFFKSSVGMMCFPVRKIVGFTLHKTTVLIWAGKQCKGANIESTKQKWSIYFALNLFGNDSSFLFRFWIHNAASSWHA
jgi:hypothetical protein